MKFIWDLLLCKCKTLEVNAEVNRWPLFFFGAAECRRVVWAAYLSRCRPSLKKLCEIFKCDFSLENHKNESLIMRDSLRAQLWAWQSYRPARIYIYLCVSVCVSLYYDISHMRFALIWSAWQMSCKRDFALLSYSFSSSSFFICHPPRTTCPIQLAPLSIRKGNSTFYSCFYEACRMGTVANGGSIWIECDCLDILVR